MPNTSIRKTTTIIYYIIIWMAVFFNHFIILYHFFSSDIYIAIVDSLVYNFVYSLIAFGIWHSIEYIINIDKNSKEKIIQNHAITALITSVLWAYSGYFILSSLYNYNETYMEFLDSSIKWRIYAGIIYYSILIAVYYVIFYYSSYRDEQEKEHRMKALVKEAELKSLKYQINPHFIFNSLNSISSLTISNPQKARDMSINLSNFLRKTLADNENQKIKLKEEIDNIKLYLEIEKVRFGERLEFVINVDENCEDYEIPNMILQPIVENTIKHGVYESIDKVTINFVCKLEEEFISILIINNFDPASVSEIGEGIGLQNIRDRLKLMYNSEDLISIGKNADIFKVSLKIPINKTVD